MSWLSRLLGADRIHPTPVRTLDQLDEVLDAGLPVIVDVWSETCAPCKRLVPVLIDVATRYEGRVTVAEISTTAEMALIRELGVRATPTLIIFDKEGEEIGRQTGYRGKQWFDEMIAAELLPASA